MMKYITTYLKLLPNMKESPIESQTIIRARKRIKIIQTKDKIVAKINPMPTIHQVSFKSLKILSP